MFDRVEISNRYQNNDCVFLSNERSVKSVASSELKTEIKKKHRQFLGQIKQ